MLDNPDKLVSNKYMKVGENVRNGYWIITDG